MLHKLGKEFAKKAHICIDINEIFKIFHLHDEHFRQDPAFHVVVLASMKAPIKSLQGPSRVYLSNPADTIKIDKSLASRFFESEYDPHDYVDVPSSSSVAFTEQDLGRGRRGFGLIIRQNAQSREDLRDSMVFGIYGTYNKTDQMLQIERLYTPHLGEGNTITHAQPIPIDEDNVKGAMAFAMLCADQIYGGEQFRPRECFMEALDVNLAEVSVPAVKTIEPK